VESAGAFVFIDVGEEGFAHEGDCFGVVLVVVLKVGCLGSCGTSGFGLELLAGEDELGVFEEEFFPVQEGLEREEGEERGERGERESVEGGETGGEWEAAGGAGWGIRTQRREERREEVWGGLWAWWGGGV
jgi:hypothetical protein